MGCLRVLTETKVGLLTWMNYLITVHGVWMFAYYFIIYYLTVCVHAVAEITSDNPVTS